MLFDGTAVSRTLPASQRQGYWSLRRGREYPAFSLSDIDDIDVPSMYALVDVLFETVDVGEGIGLMGFAPLTMG
jgi:hypothetical protein